MSKYKKLKVWHEAMAYVKEVYTFCQSDFFSKGYGLKSQIQRSAVSIPSNIAEGSEYLTNKQSVHYFNIAKASLAENLTQLEIATRIGYLEKVDFIRLEENGQKIGAMLNSLINFRKKTWQPVTRNPKF